MQAHELSNLDIFHQMVLVCAAVKGVLGDL